MILKENYYVDKSKVTTPLNGFSKNIGDVSLKEILFEIYYLLNNNRTYDKCR